MFLLCFFGDHKLPKLEAADDLILSAWHNYCRKMHVRGEAHNYCRKMHVRGEAVTCLVTSFQECRIREVNMKPR